MTTYDIDKQSDSETLSMPCDRKQKSSDKLVCLFDESPYYILKVASQGKLEEVIRLTLEDRNRLSVRDYRGQNIVHHAVTWSRVNVLDYLETFGIPYAVDINAQDKLGNSPLHHAIERNQTTAVAWLLAHNADMNVKNNHNQAPIHYAVELQRIEIVQMIVKRHSWTVKMKGDLGSTPLHYAAIKDDAKIARVLLEEGAEILKYNDTGCPPIHSATRNGAAHVIDVLLEYAELRGMSRKALMHMPDKESNLPLHGAVNSGDVKAVEICLKAGADIDVQQRNDGLTAVHLAAAQGNPKMISLMFAAQPEKQETCLHCRDILEQTPLHKAAMYNHVLVVDQLIELEASINAQDGEKRTPLLLAAAKNACDTVNFLLKRRANTSMRDKDNRNFLHLAVLNGFKIKDLDLSSVKNLGQLINERDDFGCSPIHYAAKAGQLSTLHKLLELGALPTLKEVSQKNALHFAAMYGRYETCRDLLEGEHGSMLINEVDGDGRTPLHIAASRGSYKVIALLARHGALMNKDFQQHTPLHLAAEFGHHEAVVLLVGLAPHLLNAANKMGNTALHLAAMHARTLVVDYLMSANALFDRNKDGSTFFDLAIGKFQSDVAVAVVNHARGQEVMKLPSTFGTPFIGLVQHLPKVAILFLDKCLTYSRDSKKNRNFYIRYDFRCLQMSTNVYHQQAESTPLLPLNMMVKYNRVDCLSHPVCVTFLRHKWNSFGSWFFNFQIGFYIIFLALLTGVCLDIDRLIVVDDASPLPTVANIGDHSTEVFSSPLVSSQPSFQNTPSSNRSSGKAPIDKRGHDPANSLSMNAPSDQLFWRMVLVIVFCTFNVLGQFFTMLQQKGPYFLKFTHYLEWTLYVTTFFAIAPSFSRLPTDDAAIIRQQMTCAAIALLLGWFILLFYMQRFDFFGMYVVMFLQVARTLLRALIVFSFVLIAFALSFSMVFRTTRQSTHEFKNPYISLMSTLAMMVGEDNYAHIVTPTLDGRRNLIYGDLTYIFYIAFILFIPTLLMNLLVGLAVGDIESVQKNAQLKRLAMQVEYLTLLEGKLPKSFIRHRSLTECKFYPNRSKYQILEAVRTAFKEAYRSDILVDGQDISRALENSKNDMTYLLEELTHQSEQMRHLTTKLESHHELLKLIVRKVDSDSSDGNEDADFDRDCDSENGENGDGVFDYDSSSSQQQQQQAGDKQNCYVRMRKGSNEFHSSDARAHWQIVRARLSASRKPKAQKVWLSAGSTSDMGSRRRGRRKSTVVELAEPNESRDSVESCN